MNAVFENDTRPGYGFFRLSNVPPISGNATFTLQDSGFGEFLGEGGWLGAEQALTPAAVRRDGDDVLLLVTPAVVNHLEAPTTYRLTVNDQGQKWEANVPVECVVHGPAGGSLYETVPPPPPMPPAAEPPAEVPPPAAPEPLTMTSAAPAKRNLVVPLVLAALLLCAGGAGWWWYQNQQTPKTEAAAPADAAAEKAAVEKAAAEKLAAEKAAAEKAEAEKLAAEKAAAEKAEAEKLAAEKLAAEKAEAEKLAAEKAAPAQPAQAEPAPAAPVAPAVPVVPVAPGAMEQARAFLRGQGTPADALALAKKLPAATPTDADAVFLLMETAASGGNAEAMLALARYYNPAEPALGTIIKDPEQAALWLKQAKAVPETAEAANASIAALKKWLEQSPEPSAKQLLQTLE